jgi:beta-glucuronidase
MKTIVLGAIILLAFSGQVFASTRLDLNNDWQFRTDPDQKGEAADWQKQPPSGTASINIPHTWNLGRHDRYLGKAWYFRTFELPMQSPDLHVELHFGATFYSSRIWLNGIEIGRHEGGYTAYSFNITPHLHQTNYLAVELDNRIGAATIPGFANRGKDQSWYDWWDYGGIVRDVWLTVGSPIEVKRQQIRSQISAAGAIIQDRVFLENNLKQAAKLTMIATAFGPDNQPAAHESQPVVLSPGETDAAISLKLTDPKLWSIDSPNIYRMVVQIADGEGKNLDEQSDTFGLRTVEIRDRHLFVNGERVRLTGVTRHEESTGEGLAETPGTMREDYDDMKTLQVTLTRPVHYPQNPFILDYADRHGILLIPEIPVWQFSEAQMQDPKVLALAKQQMREMIEEAGNHPSIFAWSVCNESATGTPGGIAYFRAMRDFIHTIDPGRFVSYADDKLPNLKRAEDSAANDADFLMMNQYFGSWHGPEAALPESLDKVGGMFPDKMVIISEFGLPGIFAKDPEDADRMRVKIIQDQMPELARRDWIAGAILWCYQDYKSRINQRPGWQGGYVDHGLVDEYRQRKPSYYVWKELNAPAVINAQWNPQTAGLPAAYTVTVTPNSKLDLPSYPLHNYRLAWELCDETGKLLASGEKQLADLSDVQTVSENVGDQSSAKALKLHLTLLRPTGAVAAEKFMDWHAGQSMGASAGATVSAH